MGDTLDATRATVLQAGRFGTVGANMHHYAIARRTPWFRFTRWGRSC